MSNQRTYTWIVIVLAATALSLWLIRRLRAVWKVDNSDPQVRVLGTYSPILTWLRYRHLPAMEWQTLRHARPHLRRYAVEWLIIVVVAYLYSGAALLDFDPGQLQQTGEHNESATLPLLTEIGLKRYGEIPLWNPYMLTGFPHAGDFINHFWHPVSTLPIIIWGGINGMKVSVFIAFGLAGIGQWMFAHVFGLRKFFRLWAGILFMLSGGLALLWRVGWYELLLGMAWFPWCFASLWWALHRQGRASLALTAICVAMVLTTGGGYYPFYLLVSMGVLVGMAVLWSRPAARGIKLRRAVAIAVLSAGLAAVALLPLIDGYRLTARDAGQDLEQKFSQPITYALINYVVSKPEWFRTEILGTAGGWNWYYIGYLPLAALALLPLAFSQVRFRRPALTSLSVLTLVLLAWHANRHTPVKYIYEWIPFLYNLRFPNRLLILAASALIVMAALGLQYLLTVSRLWGRNLVIAVSSQDMRRVIQMPPSRVVHGALLLIMLFSLRDVYIANKNFAFAPRPRNAKADTALNWLKSYDPGLYYINIGGGAVYWDWTPTAYELEMPIINFNYGRHVATEDQQHSPESPFFAQPRYMLALPDQPRPDNAQMLRDFDGVGLWYLPDALPFAFSAPPAMLQPYATLTRQDVSPLEARLDGPNRLVVSGQPARPGDQLVALVSDYPGWKLLVDGKPGRLSPANDYLGAVMLPGEHTYVFVFSPPKHYIGLGISLFTLGVIAYWLLADSLLPLARFRPEHPLARGQPASTSELFGEE